MLPWAVLAGNPRNLGTSELRPRELAAGAHAELGVDAGEGVGDRLGAHVERRGDLLVPLGDELADGVLARGQPPARRARPPAGRHAGAPELLGGLGAQPPGGEDRDLLEGAVARSWSPAAANARPASSRASAASSGARVLRAASAASATAPTASPRASWSSARAVRPHGAGRQSQAFVLLGADAREALRLLEVSRRERHAHEPEPQPAGPAGLDALEP